MSDDFYLKINKLKGIKIYKDIDVKEETNMKLEAKFLYKIEIASFSNVKEVFKLIKEYKLKYYILGMGSNVLFANNLLIALYGIAACYGAVQLYKKYRKETTKW